MTSRFIDRFLFVVALSFVLFHLVLPVYAFLPNVRERAIHLALAAIMIFLGGRKGKSGLALGLDLALTGLTVGICAYTVVKYFDIVEQYGTAEGLHQVVMGLVLALLILELARRAVKPALPIIATLFLLYAFLGHLIPGEFGHPRYSLETLSSMLFLTTSGLWGQLLGVSANIIAIFVFLGAFIVCSGGGTGFMKLSVRLAGRFCGGPAKVATVASALFGSISGSASANVASTGSFTIPMMKRLGYNPALAAAVEATASTGGQIMPPIMGAGAFVMAELIQTPYLTIALSAAIPAILYFFAVGAGIHFFARREGYEGLPWEEIPGWRETFRASIFFLIPFAVLTYYLILDYTPQYAAVWAVAATLPLALFNVDWKLEVGQVWSRYGQAVVSGARQASVIAAICACAQIIVAVIDFTGIGIKFSNLILSATKESLFLALVLTALTSIILGMEVPTTAAYIVAVVVSGPVLEKLGVPPLAAHLFVFYLAILSAVTPPICGAVFIAAGMAEADWVQTAKIGLKLAFAAFLLPFMFAYDPSLVLIGSPVRTALVAIKALAAITVLSAGFMGFFRSPLNWPGRIGLLAAGVFLLAPGAWTNVVASAITMAVWVTNRKKGDLNRPWSGLASAG